MAKMENQKLEDEEVMKSAASVGIDYPIVSDMECRVEQELMLGEQEADVAQYFGNNQ